jgi:mono/diheme cytochrome c family protein
VKFKKAFSCRMAIQVLLVCFGSVTLLSAETGSKTAAGEAVYKSHCVVCHGVDGLGKTTLGTQLKASDLHGKDVQKLTDAQLKEVITNGKNNMPPFSDQLTGAEINDLIKYVRTFGKAAK